MAESKQPMSLRLSPQLAERLEQCAVRLKMKKHTLAQQAVEAAVEAIEQNGYRISLPLQFRQTDETFSATSRYPARNDEVSIVAERGPEYQARRRPRKEN